MHMHLEVKDCYYMSSQPLSCHLRQGLSLNITIIDWLDCWVERVAPNNLISLYLPTTRVTDTPVTKPTWCYRPKNALWDILP